MIRTEDQKLEPNEPTDNDRHDVKSAVEIGLERAMAEEDAPIELETEAGTVSLTFDELKQKADKADEYFERIQYKQAEFDNFRKRTQKEREDLVKDTVRVADLIEVLDSLDLALATDDEESAIGEGIRMTRDRLWGMLERKGVERIAAVGEPFDPNLHEAVAKQPHDEIPDGNVAVEFQSGFKNEDRVLRASKVVVSSGPADPSEAAK